MPIYRHNRFSIRSSRHPSRANLLKQPKMAAVPSNLRSTENRPGTPLVDPEYATAPTTPTTKGEWKSFLHDASPPQQQQQQQPQTLERPPEAHTANNRDSFLTLPVMRHPSERKPQKKKTNPGLTLNLSAENEEQPPSPNDRGDRWSWTNSQAPSTPRIAAPNRRSSLTTTTSSIRVRNVASWVRNQGNRSPPPASSKEKEKDKSGSSKPLLKNQAVKPILLPNRGGAKPQHKRVGSLSAIFKGGSLTTTQPAISGPLSPRLEEGRGGGSFEMGEGAAGGGVGTAR